METLPTTTPDAHAFTNTPNAHAVPQTSAPTATAHSARAALSRPRESAQASAPNKPVKDRAYWSGVWAMSLCAFVLIASEFMPVSLLTPIAADLHVSEGQAGWGIGISGVFAVLTSLLVPQLAGQRDRRSLLLIFTAVMGASGAIIAFAPNYTIYMIGRALIGVVVGGFWSMSVAVAIRLVPLDKVPRAMAVFNGGNALATVLAAPLGSYLGALVGWRGVFLSLVPLAAATMLWQRLALPPLPAPGTASESESGKARARRNASSRTPHAATFSTPVASESAARSKAQNSVLALFLSQRVVTLGMLAVGFFFMGQFTLYTYVRPFLENATRVTEASTLSLILLAVGIAGLVGNALIGGLIQRSLYRVLITVPILMALLASGLLALGGTLAAVVALLALWGLIGTTAPVGWWSWLAQTLPKNAETGGALMVAVIQLAIGLGSFVGGLLFDGLGYQTTFAVSAALLLTAAAFANLCRTHAQ